MAEDKARRRFERDADEAMAKFSKNFFELPTHKEGYRTFVSRANLEAKPIFFEFPPGFPFYPPKIWTGTQELKITDWSPAYHLMLLLALAQDVLTDKREIAGWTVVKKTTCAVCAEIGTMRCSGCNDALYCGRACQKADWDKAHKLVCSE